MAERRNYWIKLHGYHFESNGDFDFLMSQKNGAEYIVLYQLLCLNTMNTKGELVSQLGEVIIPYDVDKITRDCKYFSRDTVVVALELYKKLGLIYSQEDGVLRITNHDEMVGSEASSAKRMRVLREKRKQEALLAKKTSHCDATVTKSDVTLCAHCYTDIDIEKDIEKEKEIEKEKGRKESRAKEKEEKEGAGPYETDPVGLEYADSSESGVSDSRINYSLSDSRINYSFFQEKWNTLCTSLPKCTLISDKRRKAIKACVNTFGADEVIRAMSLVEESDFLTGRSGAWHGCGFDWVFITGNMTKILEGNYANKKANKSSKSDEEFEKEIERNDFDRKIREAEREAEEFAKAVAEGRDPDEVLASLGY